MHRMGIPLPADQYFGGAEAAGAYHRGLAIGSLSVWFFHSCSSSPRLKRQIPLQFGFHGLNPETFPVPEGSSRTDGRNSPPPRRTSESPEPAAIRKLIHPDGFASPHICKGPKGFCGTSACKRFPCLLPKKEKSFLYINARANFYFRAERKKCCDSGVF